MLFTAILEVIRCPWRCSQGDLAKGKSEGNVKEEGLMTLNLLQPQNKGVISALWVSRDSGDKSQAPSLWDPEPSLANIKIKIFLPQVSTK